MPKRRTIFDDIFLCRPAVNVGLRKLDGIDGLGLFRSHNGNELRRRLFGRSSGGLPAFAPPGPFIRRQVAVPTRRDLCLLWIRPSRNETAQIADECYL